MKAMRLSGESPLILFSLLAQMAVGAFLTLGVLHAQAALQEGGQAADVLTGAALLAIGPLILLSLLVSLFHLGTPRNAWRAISNWRNSWLSREIVLAVLFAGLGGVFALSQVWGWGEGWLRTLLRLLAAACGVGLVYCMARVYMLRTVPVWNSWRTPLAFTLTTLLLGALLVGSALALDPLLPAALSQPALGAVAWVVLVLLSVQLGVTALGQSRPESKKNQPVLLLRVGLLAAGLIMVGMLLVGGESLPWMPLTFAASLFSEMLGRYLFYASYERVGV
ncbi:MAG: dimethyl sulfoxide reductase anchor subunit [Anaerolineales bacterium]|nr:dimethyl sulfoxide reductase anchor subunit [Anaerolineales bacterium]